MSFENEEAMFDYLEKLNQKQLAFVIKSLIAAGHIQAYIVGKAIDLAETIKP